MWLLWLTHQLHDNWWWAEKEGFEPSRRFSRPTPFPGEPLRPAWVFLHADTYRVSFYIILLLFPVFKKNFIKFDFKSSSFLIAEAERMGFEPMCPWGQTVFKTAALWPLRYLSKTVAQHLFSLDSHSMFSREQMIYYQNHLALSMMNIKNIREF